MLNGSKTTKKRNKLRAIDSSNSLASIGNWNMDQLVAKVRGENSKANFSKKDRHYMSPIRFSETDTICFRYFENQEDYNKKENGRVDFVPAEKMLASEFLEDTKRVDKFLHMTLVEAVSLYGAKRAEKFGAIFDDTSFAIIPTRKYTSGNMVLQDRVFAVSMATPEALMDLLNEEKARAKKLAFQLSRADVTLKNLSKVLEKSKLEIQNKTEELAQVEAEHKQTMRSYTEISSRSLWGHVTARLFGK